MSINDDYFVLERENIEVYPVISWGNTEMPAATALPDSTILELIWAEPIPENGIMVDYHGMPDAIISEKIKNILDKDNIKDIQLVSSTITAPNNERFEKYYLFHIFNQIECLDHNNSDIDFDDDLGIADNITSFMLDEKKLQSIKLEDRLVFIVKEFPILKIIHKTIKEKILSTSPKGVRFIPIKEWNDDINFN